MTSPSTADLSQELARRVWDLKYRFAGEVDYGDTARRVARALAAAEAEGREAWALRFEEALRTRLFLPGGRILAGAGTSRRATLLNCFVMGVVEDSMDGIFNALRDTAITLQQGGGVGLDFSTLRPRGTPARAAAAEATGPVSFMRIWDLTSEVLFAVGSRRGAMMATLRCDHPDILEFISAKAGGAGLGHFNLSVQVTDELLGAVERDEPWPLVFPSAAPGDGAGVLRTIPARELWDRLVRAAWDWGEPGVLFVDVINRNNNLWWRERITATNPCGEEPLPPHGACDLGSLNLVRFVRRAFRPEAHVDLQALAATAALGVRMLDDALDVSLYPLAAQEAQSRGSRRIGLGVTGLADALAMLRAPYGSEKARALSVEILTCVRDAAYRASTALAAQKGPFPFFLRDRYLEAPFVRALPGDIRHAIARSGIRNSHLLAVAPAGTISLLAGNVSSGIEPVFAVHHVRRLLEGGAAVEYPLESYALRLWKGARGEEPPPPELLEDSRSLPPMAHLEMQAALQPLVDGAISKTLNLSPATSFEQFRPLFQRARALGLKGCTAFRLKADGCAVLEPVADERVECCHPEPAGAG